ncbi:hypothetical protein [Candidatus Solirubrobacter pratensis]|uniref:hypothetical protein n=1 Tax=Candidatus Solirubrobacter pratensis TaxID=1298857 RepID=UPI0003FE5476|nr:hypothetical protein [Candidatus Solirubrobacter pratensis]
MAFPYYLNGRNGAVTTLEDITKSGTAQAASQKQLVYVEHAATHDTLRTCHPDGTATPGRSFTVTANADETVIIVRRSGDEKSLLATVKKSHGPDGMYAGSDLVDLLLTVAANSPGLDQSDMARKLREIAQVIG